jgi:DnaJ-class molecular chaperone
VICETCHGTGWDVAADLPCQHCNGTGRRSPETGMMPVQVVTIVLALALFALMLASA